MGMAVKNVSSFDVARAAGVSQSTVSRVFNKGAGISPATREKVLDAADKLGYTTNAIARSLITGRSGIVGIVMADISNPFYPNVLEQFTRRLQEVGRRVLLFNVAPDRDVDDALPLVLQYQVDAVVITSATLSSQMADECARRGTRVVLFNRHIPGAKVSAVCCDNVAGGCLVANILLEAGHRHVAYIAGRKDTSTNVEREAGFSSRLRERAYVGWLRDQGQYTYESGYEAARRLLQRDDPPDAIFCANDIMALGAIDLSRELGIRIPEDLSIIGFDDIPAANWSAYSLTTIRQPIDRMIDITLELVDPGSEPPDTSHTLHLVPGVLVERKSARIAPRVTGRQIQEPWPAGPR